MQLWFYWWDTISMFRPAFSRKRTFMWFVVCVAGLTTRTDLLGVTSIVRALGLREKYYGSLLANFHSAGIDLDKLTKRWVKIVTSRFPGIFTINDRIILVGDGIKTSKQGKKMPSVKLLHQESESNTKAEYIMGHSYQSISVLVQSAKTVFAVPLATRIHEGIVLSNRSKKTLLDKMIGLLLITSIEQPYYFVADAYYASGKIVKGLLQHDNHLVTRAKSNSVAYEAAPQKSEKTRGRPKTYGKKVKLSALLNNGDIFEEADSPVYGEEGVTIQFRTHDLLWKPAGRIVRFVLVIHPTRGRCILMSTDLALTAIEIIKIYGLRFKIEHAFKQAVHVIGTFGYHFWMKEMKPLKRRNGNQYLHRESQEYRDKVKRKINSYHVFVHAGIVAQGLLQYLAICHSKLVWNSFGSWLRTIRPGIAPSEFVTATALRHTLPEFLGGNKKDENLAKFIADRQDPDRMVLFRLAS